ncbi:MAG: glycosyltransferase family 4 protein [Bacteroidales bacterium]
MKKHILILGCKNYPAFSSRKVISGGMEVYVTEIINYLKKDFRFTVIAGYSYSDDVDVRVISVPLIGKFALQPISLTLFSFFIALWQVIKGTRYDLVNAQTPLSGFIGFVLKKLFGIPYVVTVHIFAATTAHVGWAAKIYGYVEKLVLRHADKVISAGFELKKYLDTRYDFNDDHVMVIHPGMDVVGFTETNVNIELREKLRVDQYKILFMGRLIEENGVKDLLEAVRRLKGDNFRLYFAGNGNLEKLISTFIDKEQLREKVFLLGLIRGDDKQYLIRNVDLSIRTSYHEVFPVAYLESVSVGVPVIATPVGDTVYLAEQTTAITVVPVNDPDKAALAIKDQMIKGPLPEESVMKAQSFIESISWGKQSLQTLNVFKVIMEDKQLIN